MCKVKACTLLWKIWFTGSTQSIRGELSANSMKVVFADSLMNEDEDDISNLVNSCFLWNIPHCVSTKIKNN